MKKKKEKKQEPPVRVILDERGKERSDAKGHPEKKTPQGAGRHQRDMGISPGLHCFCT